MSESPYKRPILEQAINDLKARKGTYINGPHYKAAVRNPAFCIMSWSGGSIPNDTIKWNETYRESRHFKPAPALKSVTIGLNSNENTALLVTAEFVVQVFTKSDFVDVTDSLCKLGLLLNFEWGYSNPFGEGYSGKKISGFKLCGFTFNTEADGTYIIEGKAVGPCSALQGLNANFEVKSFPYRAYINDGKYYPVTGIVELLTYWAQGNGAQSIDDMDDGEVLIVPAGTRSDGSGQPMGSIMIFDSEHLNKKGLFAAIGRGWKAMTETTNELNKTSNIVYISLETLVGLFNTEVFPMYKETATTENSLDFKKLKILFDPEMSFSYIDPNIRSAYPTKVLLMNRVLGDYKNVNGEGKNFWEDAKNKAAVECVVSANKTRAKIDPKRIFIERGVIIQALDGTYQKQSPATMIDTRVNRDASINVDEFFKRIFEEIKTATGDRISLVMSTHPDVFDANDEKAYNLYIYDETNGFSVPPTPVWEFNPIDGDGTTRTFTIKSDIGSQNFQLSQYYGPTMTTDVMARTENLLAVVDAARAGNRAKALLDIQRIIKNPGALGDGAFDDVQMQALKSHYVTLKDCEAGKLKYNIVSFIGLAADVELDGIWGIGPGSGIWSTQMPDSYKQNQIYFIVMSTTHRFDGETSDWATHINAVVCTTDLVRYMS